MDLIQGVAWASGLVPLLALAVLSRQGGHPAPSYWFMASGFAVSWLADTAAFLTSAPFVSQVYLPLQASLFVVALAPSRWVERLIGGLLGIASLSVVLRHGIGLDIMLHVSAWATIVSLALRARPPLRTILAAGFAGEIIAWCLLVGMRDIYAWLAMQEIRVFVAAAWCVAVWQEQNSRPTFLRQEKYNA